MATRPTAIPSIMTKEEFEGRRREIALGMLETTHDILKWDRDFNKNITAIAEILVAELKKNPDVFKNSGNVRDLLNELAARTPGGKDSSGSDTTGGDVWDDILKAIVGILTGEKELIVRIIEKIFGL